MAASVSLLDVHKDNKSALLAKALINGGDGGGDNHNDDHRDDVNENGDLSPSDNNDVRDVDWGFPLNELYKLALTFHKEKEGKALHLSYEEKTQLVARSQQAAHGPLRSCVDHTAARQVGYLDVIGRDRRQAWQALGDISKEDAMRDFVRILDEACPLFRTYVEAHKRDLDERERLRQEEEDMRRRRAEDDEEQRRAEEEAHRLRELEVRRLEFQRQQIQDALNQQTLYQFKAYAEQQFPNDVAQQSSLIGQLQEQHYQQYVQQVYEQQQIERQQKCAVVPATAGSTSTAVLHRHEVSIDNRNGNRPMTDDDDNDDGNADDASKTLQDEESNCSSRSRTPDVSSVKPASMWTRKEIVEFKRSVTGEEGCGDSVIKVGHGETVTVRVPTHEDGTCLFWEFATDSYDIGFGVFFEWTETPDAQVSVHVSDSEDEDENGDDDDDEDGAVAEEVLKNGDVERGFGSLDLSSLATASAVDPSPPLTVIIPIYRRDCHEEVYAGSHVYPPSQGVYLLKFDNSYSLWRSKTLYYRVYYTH